MCTNIGLGGTSKEAKTHHSQIIKNAKNKYRKLHDRMTTVYNNFGIKTDYLLLQELGYTNLKPIPFVDGGLRNYSKEAMDNKQIDARGVGIFCESNDTTNVVCLNNQDEITCIVDYYHNLKHQKVKVAIINVYRRIHKDTGRSIKQTEETLKIYIKNLREVLQVRNIIIAGDFNYEGIIELGQNFKELKDDRMYHQHNPSTAKKYIDRIFVNFESVGILDVLPSVEEKNNDPNNVLGHKVACLYIGRKPEKSSERFKKRKAQKVVTLKMLRIRIRAAKPKFAELELGEDCGTEVIDYAVEELLTVSQNEIDQATKTLKIGEKSNNHYLIDELQRAEDQMAAGRKHEKTFYSAFRNMTKGMQNKNDSTNPN